MLPLLTSLCLFGSIALFGLYVYRYGWGWFDRRTAANAIKYQEYVDELFLGWAPKQAHQAAVAANLLIVVAFAGVLLITGSFIFAAAAALGAYFVPNFLFQLARQRRLKRFEEQLPDAIEVMVASVRAGRSLAQAVEDVAAKVSGPVGQEFGVIAREYRHGGVSIEEALRRTRERLDLENFTMMSSALIINSERGGDVLLMLERISASIREITRLQKKIVSEMSEVRAQQKIILFLTPVFGGLVCLFDPAIPGILFHTILGNLLLVAVLGLQVFGLLWVRKIIRTAI
jgi:tight adherence protein B